MEVLHVVNLPLLWSMIALTLLCSRERRATYGRIISGYTRTYPLVGYQRLMPPVLVLGDCYSLLAMIRAVFTLNG